MLKSSHRLKTSSEEGSGAEKRRDGTSVTGSRRVNVETGAPRQTGPHWPLILITVQGESG